ncbi:glycosyltransferase [Owenweeksia hongkongensis]|uniref:glycosyltransferase n=1 Tax=Owenweeksia hongkongensis TaxID=253245 RepID=UPI003A8FA5D7
MKSLQTSARISQFSFFLFCSFPLLIDLHLKGAVAITFLILQLFVLTQKKANSYSSEMWLPAVLTLPFLFYVISLTYSDDVATGYKYVERTVLLIMLPWLLYLNRGTISAFSFRNTLRFFVLITILLTIYSLGSLFWRGTFQNAYSAGDAYYWIRTELELVSGLHPTYFSLILALGLFTTLHEIKQKTLASKKIIWSYLVVIVLLFGLLVASSKMILMSTFIGAIIIYSEGLSLKAIALRFGLIASVILVLTITVRPLRERVETLFYAATEPGVEQNNPDSLRKGIYKSTNEAISENIWFGTGIGDYQNALSEKYKKYGYTVARDRVFNTHNQYLQIWLSVGILPLFLFVLSIVAQFFVAYVSKNYLHIAFVVMMSLSFLTENILARQDGIFFYSFFSVFFCLAAWSAFKGRIFINGRFRSQTMSGVQRFADEVSQYLLNPEKNFTLIVSTKSENSPSQTSVSWFGSHGVIWEQVVLPIYLRLLGSPLLLNFCNSAPLLYKNQIVTIHDLAFVKSPSWFSERFVKWYSYLIPKIAKRSRHILTVSDFSKTEIVKELNIPKEKISVCYNGVPTFLKGKSVEPNHIDGDYVLTVGSISERKNQAVILEAFLEKDDSNLKLVVAGGVNEEVFGSQQGLLDKVKEAPNIIFIEHPTDDQLEALYKHSVFTIYLPHYEGFGLPVLESLACGTPVLVSDIAVFRELFSPYVEFHNTDNNTHIRGKILDLYSASLDWKKRLPGVEILKEQYSYKKSAEEIEGLAQRLMVSIKNEK